VFKVSRSYRSLMGTEDTSLLSNGSRKVLVSRSIRCFCLLLIHNRLNIWATLQRKNFFVEDYTCIMCNWGTLGSWKQVPICFLSALSPPFVGNVCALPGFSYLCSYQRLGEVFDSLETEIGQPFFMELIVVIASSIRTTWNDFIFKGVPPSLYCCMKKF
jgi:hypothetical protein